jgi:hypothetical protein
MKKIIMLFSIILLVVLIVALINSKKNKDSDDFFYWIDGYVAFEDKTSTSFALTYYFDKKKEYIDFNKINRIEFLDANNISITNYTIAEMEFGNNAKYSGYSITLNVYSHSIGTDSVNYIKIYTSQDNYKIYPIGTWFFDIGEKENTDLLDTWSSPVITGNSDELIYSYKPKFKDIKIIELTYGKNESIKSLDGIEYENHINITNSVAPVKYIKTKMIVEKDNQRHTIYGKGCYCGGMMITDESVELSRQTLNIK